MATYYFVRHGTAYPPEAGQQDFDRALSLEGTVLVEKMAKKLEGIPFDAMILSPARRSRETATILRPTLRQTYYHELYPLMAYEPDMIKKTREIERGTLADCSDSELKEAIMHYGKERALHIDDLVHKRIKQANPDVLIIGHGIYLQAIAYNISFNQHSRNLAMYTKLDEGDCLKIDTIRHFESTHIPAKG